MALATSLHGTAHPQATATADWCSVAGRKRPQGSEAALCAQQAAHL